MSSERFTCPCCGHRTFTEPPGSYDICKVCFWEDDPIQLLDPVLRGGANGPSLMECQANYRNGGVSEERFREHVRPPRDEESVDPEWRPARESDLRGVTQMPEVEPGCVATWYYWKRKPS